VKECASESVLALYVEADLPEPQMDDIRRHLLQCPACQSIVAELTDTQYALKTIRQDVAPASAHVFVREHVMGKIAQPFVIGWGVRVERMLCGIRWRYAVCCMALLGIVGAVLWQFQRVEQSGRVAVVNPSSAPAFVSQPERPAVVAPSISPRMKLVRKPRNQPAAPHEISVAVQQPEPIVIDEKAEEPQHPVMVKLMTDDPGVVIYWIVDQNGGSE
jgi:hypothetical protein